MWACHTVTGAGWQAKRPQDIETYVAMYSEVQKVVDSKQLHPMVRTQYMRTAFQIPYDATVRISLDTNLTMIKENPDHGPTCHEAGRCVQRAGVCVRASTLFACKKHALIIQSMMLTQWP